MLAVTDNTVRLLISLPDTIPDVFSLHLRYVYLHMPFIAACLVYRYSNVLNSSLTHDIVVQDASFSHTNIVNYTLSPAELPPQFPSFTLRVALEVYNVVGQFSNPSEPVNYSRKLWTLYCITINFIV